MPAATGAGIKDEIAVAQTNNTGGASTQHQHPFSANLSGGLGQAHRTIGPRKLCTFYIKL